MPRQVTSIAIPAVLDISEGVLGRLDEILRKHQFDKAIMFFDDFSYQQYEHSLKTAFQHVKVEAVLLPSNLDIQEAFEAGIFDRELRCHYCHGRRVCCGLRKIHRLFQADPVHQHSDVGIQ